MSALLTLYNKITNWLERLPGADFSLAARLAAGYPFWVSGRGKADSSGGFFDLADYAVYPFEEDYNVPFLDPEVAAQFAMYGETILPLLLVFGLFTRFASAGLLVMVAVITISYPAGFKLYEFAAWLVPLFALFLKGGGKLSADYLLWRLFGKKTV